MPGLHAPAARAAGDGRPPPARVGRDARARPRALPLRRRAGRAVAARRGRARRLDAAAARRRRDQMRNSLDAVADRDFALDYLYACAVLFSHLSRIGEELVLWTTSEFGFVRLPEDAATGSSMMPQKLNPDVAELARGKAGTAIGRLTGPARGGEGPAARLRPRPAGGQAARVPRAARRGRCARRADGARARARARPRPARGRDRRSAAPATDAAEALVRGRAVPRRARAGRGAGPRRHIRCARGAATRAAPGPGGVGAALAAARERLGR